MSAPLRLVHDGGLTRPGLLPHAVRYPRERDAAVVVADAESLADHLHRLGPRPDHRDPGVGDALLDRMTRIGLTGRGGGHFPAAAKWRAVRESAQAGRTVVANGAEGEPWSRKDAALLALRPHLVLDGLFAAAETLGADEAVVWLHEGDRAARSAVERALGRRTAAGLDEPPVRVATGPDHYLTGESSAVAEGVAGRTPLPVFRRVRTARAEPATLVHNVETLARVGLLARGVAAAGSVLLSVAVDDSVTVLELPDDRTVDDAVRTASGHDRYAAVLLGGYGGTWLDRDAARALPLRQGELAAHGLSLGAGVVGTLAADRCGLVELARIARFLAASSARQCGPCGSGLAAIAASTTALAEPGRRHRREAARLARFVAEVTGRGACHHPDGAARMVASGLAVFADDVTAHLRGRCLRTVHGRDRRG